MLASPAGFSAWIAISMISLPPSRVASQEMFSTWQVLRKARAARRYLCRMRPCFEGMPGLGPALPLQRLCLFLKARKLRAWACCFPQHR